MACFEYESIEVDDEYMIEDQKLQYVTTFSFRRGSSMDDNIELVCERRNRRYGKSKDKISLYADPEELRAIHKFIGSHLEALHADHSD